MSEIIEIDRVAVRRNVSARDLSTYKGGGVVRVVYEPLELTAAVALLRELDKRSIRYCVLGGGSNTLIADSGFGTVVATRALKEVSIHGKFAFCLSGASIYDIISYATSRGKASVDFLYGVPCSVGGAVIMNAGAFSHEMSEFVEQVTLYHEGEVYSLKRSELSFGYRKSCFPIGSTILSVKLSLHDEMPEILTKTHREYIARRRSTQPQQPSLGSVFKSVEGLPSGRLIESLGLKGLRFNGAEISKKHANFIVNLGGGTATDYITLIKTIEYVAQRNGYEPQKEICILDERQL